MELTRNPANFFAEIGQRIGKAVRSVTAQTDQQPGGDPQY